MKKKMIVAALLGLFAQVAPGATAPTSMPAAPDDQYFSQQWSLSNDGSQSIMIEYDGSSGIHTISQQAIKGIDISWLDAQAEVSQLAKNPVIVAVIDSGVDPTHPDLQGRISSDGYDFLAKTAKMADDMGHGTHVSGIIAANSNNAIGISGIAPPSVTILPLRILTPAFNNFAFNGELVSNYAADAINYAVAHHASIINMSMGWPKIVDTPNVRTAVQNAIQNNVMMIVAAGNDKKDQPTFPCSYEGVICVGSITNTGALAIYSNTGGQVDLLAPGDGIVSTFPKNIESQNLRIQGYEMLNGTSQASPEVAAIAAILKSSFPTATNDEIEARLILSTAPLPSQASSLYGMVNLKRALDAKPQTVLIPDFKGDNEYIVDESSLEISGQVSLSSLWKTATGVKVQVLVNGTPAGSAQAASLAEAQKTTVQWSYKFASLDVASDIPLTMVVSDEQGDSKTFSLNITAERDPNAMIASDKNQQVVTANGVPPTAWLGNNILGLLYTNLNTVDNYGSTVGATRYFNSPCPDPNTHDATHCPSGSILNIFDSTSPSPVINLNISAIQNIIQVSRLDVNGDGVMDWMVSGTGVLNKQPYLFFYFMNSQFQPLWGTAVNSTWQLPIQTADPAWQLPIRRYSSPGSWIRVSTTDPKLYPSFMAPGGLPAIDNFSELDSRHNQTAMHLYYLAPVANTPAGQPLTLQLRAADNQVFRTANPTISLQNRIPPAPQENSAGHVRILLENGTETNSATSIWDIPNIAAAVMTPAPGWDSLSSSGQGFANISGASTMSDGFLSFFTPESGSIAWSTPQGQFLDRTEFEYSQSEDLIDGPIINPSSGSGGIFDLGKQGRYWFIQTSFDLVGYHQPQGAEDSAITTQQMSIERDSSFQSQPFSDTLTPVIVGTTANPLPGVYVDSTLVRGNRVSVAVWNSSSSAMIKPLRYSLQVPVQCTELNPGQVTAQYESFTIPFLCQNGNATELRLIDPAK
jgi:cell wall-associated protease